MEGAINTYNLHHRIKPKDGEREQKRKGRDKEWKNGKVVEIGASVEEWIRETLKRDSWGVLL